MNKRRAAICNIKVEKLFGLYDYEIPPSGTEADIEKVLILYGDNGSGKTTILRLIFHMLAPEPRQGHKTFMARTKFRNVQIAFASGYELRASRPGPDLLGSFSMELTKKGHLLSQTDFVANSESRIPADAPEAAKNDEFLRAVGALKLSLYLLSDDRTVRIFSPESLEMRTYGRLIEQELLYAHPTVARRLREGRELDPEQISILLLERSIERALAWIRHQVIRASARGESDVNQLISDMIQRLVAPPERPGVRPVSRRGLRQRIVNTDKRNRRFSKFGLTPSFTGDVLLGQLEGVPGTRLSSLRPALTAYLDSFEAKLDALEEVRSRVETLVTTLNSFLVDKRVQFKVETGLLIASRDRENLRPATLSSGERHLLLLFCNVLTAPERASIFIIDEPEISLNVKWKRKLVASLLDCAAHSPLQYIFATHSMEILAEHMDSVVKLDLRRTGDGTT